MDIYQSGEPCTDPRPFIVMIHGGGFVGGSRRQSQWIDNAEEMASRGFVAASIDYRVEGDDPVPSAEFTPVLDAIVAANPDTVDQAPPERVNAIISSFEDATNAIRFLIREADDYCIDPETFGIWGGSAGAFITLHTSYGLDEFSINVPKPDVVVDYWGGFFLDDILAADDPPFLIVHGTNDPTVDFQFALDLEQDALALSVDHSFYTIEGGGHGFGGTQVETLEVNGTTLIDLTYSFLEDHLRGNSPVYETVTLAVQGN